MQRRCSLCEYWAPPEHGRLGECRLNAPQLSSAEENAIGYWPMTLDTAWCGEFSALEAAPEVALEAAPVATLETAPVATLEAAPVGAPED